MLTITDINGDDCSQYCTIPVSMAVPNASFENPVVASDGAAAAVGWTSNGGAPTGGVNNFVNGFSAAADGDQFHFPNLPGFGGPNPSVSVSSATSWRRVCFGRSSMRSERRRWSTRRGMD